MRFIFLILMLCLGQSIFAQDKKNDKKKVNKDELSLENDTLPNMEYRLISDSVRKAENAEQRKRKASRKKKKEKKIYFGIKTKVLSVRSENKVEVAQFIPATYLLDNPYQQAIYYYDKKKRKISSDTYQNLSNKLKKGLQIHLLHGKFERIKNGNLQATGYYYKGLEHDIWKIYTKDGTSDNSLDEKITYHMGFSAESRISYYDSEETKIKEITPIEHKILHGTYYSFYENGTIAEIGEYKHGEKVDIWTTYYENRQKKKQIQYTPNYSWHTPADPYIYMEWEKTGKVVYEYKKGQEKRISD